MSHDVFISYSTKDKTTADAICHVLEQNNLKCWIAPRNITAGMNYTEEILYGIDTAKLVVLVFSKNSQESIFVNNEINRAFSKNKPIISFKIDETFPKEDMEYYLKNKHWLEAYPEPEKEFETLIRDALKWCNEDVGNISYSFKDFMPEDSSKLKRNYWSIILLLTPLFGLSFIYMGIVGDKNLWKGVGVLYLLPLIFCLIVYFNDPGSFFFVYPLYCTFIAICALFWILAIIHAIVIRKEFLNRKAVLRMMSSDDELFDSLLNEYSEI